VVDARNAPEAMLRLVIHTGPPGTVSSRRELVSFFSGPAPVLLAVLLRSCLYCYDPEVLEYSVPTPFRTSGSNPAPIAPVLLRSPLPMPMSILSPMYYILPGHLGRDVPVTAFPTTSPGAGGSRSTHGDTSATFLAMRRTLPLEGSRPGAWEE
jgi:hypothetical protein